MGLLRFILIALLVYFVLRMLWRAYGPWLMRKLLNRFVQRMQADMEKQQRRRQQAYDQSRKYHRSKRMQVDDRTELYVPEEDREESGQGEKRKYRGRVQDVDFEEIN